jgi:hypothetical protein
MQPIFTVPSSLIAVAPIPISMEQSTDLRGRQCLVGFLHASHSFFRHRSHFDLPHDGLLEAVDITLTHYRRLRTLTPPRLPETASSDYTTRSTNQRTSRHVFTSCEKEVLPRNYFGFPCLAGAGGLIGNPRIVGLVRDNQTALVLPFKLTVFRIVHSSFKRSSLRLLLVLALRISISMCWSGRFAARRLPQFRECTLSPVPFWQVQRMLPDAARRNDHQGILSLYGAG